MFCGVITVVTSKSRTDCESGQCFNPRVVV